VANPGDEHEDANPPERTPSEEVSNVFPSRVKELNLESSSLMVEREASTSGFQVVRTLSVSAAADSNTATRSLHYYAVVASSVTRLLMEASCLMKLSHISVRSEWISLRTSHMISMNNFVFGSMAP
jgi:hypothetical protein